MGAGTVYDEHVRHLWFDEADTPTDLEAITTTELADAFDFSEYVVDFNHGGSNDRVDDSDYLDPFKAESMGMYGNQPSAILRRKLRSTGAETAYTTFTRRVAGTLVIFETLDPGADPGVGDSYKAYPTCECGEPNEQNMAHNQSVRFGVDWAVGSAPVRGTVVAS